MKMLLNNDKKGVSLLISGTLSGCPAMRTTLENYADQIDRIRSVEAT